MSRILYRGLFQFASRRPLDLALIRHADYEGTDFDGLEDRPGFKIDDESLGVCVAHIRILRGVFDEDRPFRIISSRTGRGRATAQKIKETLQSMGCNVLDLIEDSWVMNGDAWNTNLAKLMNLDNSYLVVVGHNPWLSGFACQKKSAEYGDIFGAKFQIQNGQLIEVE